MDYISNTNENNENNEIIEYNEINNKIFFDFDNIMKKYPFNIRNIININPITNNLDPYYLYKNKSNREFKNYIIDNDERIWFNFINIAKIKNF